MSITIQKSASGASFTVLYAEQTTANEYQCGDFYFEPNLDGTFNLINKHGYAINLINMAVSNVINGDTGLAFTDMPSLKTYISNNFFRKAGGAATSALPAQTAPNQLTGLQAWYDLTDLATVTTNTSLKISSIQDKSSNGNTLLQATSNKQPLMVFADADNGKPAIHINGGTNILKSSFSLALPYTFYALIKQNTFTTDSIIIGLGGGNTNALVQKTSSDGGTGSLALAAGVNWRPTLKKTYKTQWVLYRISNVGGLLQYAMNGDPLMGANTNFTMTVGSTAISALQIGDTGASPDFYLQELIVLDHNTTNTEHYGIWNYFKYKYHMASTKPYRAWGDSITAGQLSSDAAHSYAYIVAANLSGDLYNNGIPSATIGYGVSLNAINLNTLLTIDLTGWDINGLISLCYGANETPDANWAAMYQSVVQRFLDFGFTKKQICLVTQIKSTAAIDAAQPYIIQVVNNTGVLLADCYTYSLTHPGLIASGPHPNDAGHAAMGAIITTAFS